LIVLLDNNVHETGREKIDEEIEPTVPVIKDAGEGFIPVNKFGQTDKCADKPGDRKP
jgi:hypothetical protein